MERRERLRGLYAISPDDHDAAQLAAAVDAVLAGGARLLQYRRKSSPGHARADEAAALLAACRRHDAMLIINDDPALAAAVGADGVHLGRDDVDPQAARRLLGPAALIGVSCYGSLSLAEAAVEAGADYVAFGSMFASTTKPGAPRAPIELLAAAARLGRPVCAIGGITLDRAPALIAAGASMLAVIGDLFGSADPGAVARGYARAFAATALSSTAAGPDNAGL